MSYLDVFLHKGSLSWELDDPEEEASFKQVSQAISYLMKNKVNFPSTNCEDNGNGRGLKGHDAKTE